MKLDQSIINHVVFVLDASSSMQPLVSEVIQVADAQVKELARISTEMDQETRATVYTFANPGSFQCVYYDKGVLRLPSLASKYRASGNTALIDATLRAVSELGQTATLYGDHAFLVYVLTDGKENASQQTPRILNQTLSGLKDNWTVAALVPNVRGERYAKQFGFMPGNIAIWSTTEAGVREVGKTIQAATQNFVQQRSLGVRGTKNLFQVSTSINDLSILKPTDPSSYEILFVGMGEQRQIRDFVEQESHKRKIYRKGCAFYQLTKKEEVQPDKEVAILDTKKNVLYRGQDARQAIGIPTGQYVDVLPENHADKIIFVQSNSVNRKLVPNTMVVVV